MRTRREFLEIVALAGGGLAIGVRLGAEPAAVEAAFRPNAWVRIEGDGRIVVVVGKSEMGQGPRTALPMILAEELGVDLDQVVLEQASPGPDYRGLGTGGSASVSGSWWPLRKAGAAARMMLVAAAAERWGAPIERCHAHGGQVFDSGSDRSATYGELAAAAARQPVPEKPRLTRREAFRLIGTSPRRIDGPAIVTGRANYGIDVRLPGQKFAVVARPPVLGGAVKTFDAASALARPGVEACFAIPSGIAVVARSSWAALRGRDALRVEWEPGANVAFSSSDYIARMVEQSKAPGVTTRRDGRSRDALAQAASRLEAAYVYPFEAHASVEPVNSTARVAAGHCEIWSPTQNPEAVRRHVGAALGLPEAGVTVHVTLLGGGFGRRLGWDFDVEAAEVARRVGAPVQLLWSREDDLRHGYFQSAAVDRLRAGLDAKGKLIAWQQCKVSKPHDARGKPTPAESSDPAYLRDSEWGVYDNPYVIPHLETTYAVADCPVPIGPWRAVFAPSSVYARECFVDEIAEHARRDPLALRLELLGADDPAVPVQVDLFGTRLDRSRLAAVLRLATDKAGWSRALPAGHSRGLACDVFHNGTCTAYAVEVSRRAGSLAELPFRIERVVGAIDCGLIVNPDGVAQQVESGVIWSLSNLKTEITFEKGAARESNFDGFRVTRIGDCPPIEVHLVASDDELPHGVGEPTVSALAPAVVNALSRLVGKRIRRLPVTAADLA